MFRRLGVQPPPPPSESYRSTIEIEPKPVDEPQRIDIKIDPVDGQRLLNLLQTQTAASAKLVITTHVPDATHTESSLPTPSPVEKNNEVAPAESAAPSPQTETEQVE